MILPNVRASIGRADTEWMLRILADYDGATIEHEAQRMRSEGLDVVLDDPRTLNAVLTTGMRSMTSAPLSFYVLVRHALLESGIEDRHLADYLAALLLRFGRLTRTDDPDQPDSEQYPYLIDIIQALETANGRRAFLLRTHLGNFSLWLSGVFPDRVAARVQRRGAPGIRYYEEVGAAGYRLAAETADAASHGLNEVLDQCARLFPDLRIALNRLSDRYLFPQNRNSIERMLRQVRDRPRSTGETGPGE